MKTANPYVNFSGNTEEAFNFYRSVFGGEFLALLRYRDFGGEAMGLSPTDLEKVAHVALPLGASILMGTDVLESQEQKLSSGNSVYVAVETESVEEAETIFARLSSGGNVEMPLAVTEWAERYGAFADQFGLHWMISYTGSVSFEPG